jgi:hypothetical protein
VSYHAGQNVQAYRLAIETVQDHREQPIAGVMAHSIKVILGQEGESEEERKVTDAIATIVTISATIVSYVVNVEKLF